MVIFTARQIRFTYNLAGIIEPNRTPVISSERAEIRKHPPVPKKGMRDRVSGQAGVANDLSWTLMALARPMVPGILPLGISPGFAARSPRSNITNREG